MQIMTLPTQAKRLSEMKLSKGSMAPNELRKAMIKVTRHPFRLPIAKNIDEKKLAKTSAKPDRTAFV